MKVFRTILTVIACLFIVLGLASVVIYEMNLHKRANEPPTQVQQPDPEAAPEPEPEPEPDTESEPEPEEAPQTEEQAQLQARAEELLADMTLEEKIYQLFFITPESITGVEVATRAGDATREALEQFPVGGIIYARDNIEDEEQLTELLSGTQGFMTEAKRIPLFLAVDEEGGEVAPVADALGTTSFNDMEYYAAVGDAEEVLSMGQTISADISQFGFNVNFAPVADLSTNVYNPVLGTRAFGDDPENAAEMVGAMVQGLQESGTVLSAVTHFPGIGRASDVAHITPTLIDRSLDGLMEEELKPFIAAIEQKVGFVIVSHSIVTGLSSNPCSMSSAAMTDLLRDELGYTGIIMTDVLDVPAITDTYTNAEAAVTALSAGADMLLCPDELLQAYTGIEDAIADGTLTEERIDESVLRILAAKLSIGLIQ